MEIRELTTIDELQACEDIERRVWTVPDLEIMPASHLAATVHAGGLVAGAFDAGTMIGFVYGFVARRHDYAPHTYGMHSHLLAVLPQYRNTGVGKKLKLYQRGWCLSRELPWITWTFDPLQAKNARLNLEHLGATATEYNVNVYGTLGGTLNAELPTDRLLAFWDIATTQPQKASLRTTSSEQPPLSETPLVLAVAHDQEPQQVKPYEHADTVRIQIPDDITAIIAADPQKALRWRLALRDAMTYYLSRDYTVTHFIDSRYVLTR